MSIREIDTAYNTTKPISLQQIVTKKDGANAAIGGGVEDGNPTDDIVAGQSAAIPVTQLKPAQTEIIKEKAFGMAIAMLNKGKWNGLDLGAIVSNDNYIMDGHHRWAAVSLIDPNAKVQVTAIDLPGGPLVSVLNVVTVGKLGITTGNRGKGSVADFTGDKFLSVIDSALVKGIQGEFPIKPEQVKDALSNMPGANGNAEEGKRIMMSNADALPKKIMPNAPPRLQMPVIDTKKVNMTKKMLEKGLVDINPPYTLKVKKSFNLKEQVTLCQHWMRTRQALKELKFTSAGVPQLLQLVYDDYERLLPQLDFEDFKQFLYYIKHGDQEEHRAIVDKLKALNIPGATQLISEMKKTTKTRLEEELVRRLIRKHLLEAESEKDKPEGEDIPEPEVEEEPTFDPELADITDLYIKKLKNAKASVEQGDMVEIIGSLLDSFGYGNQDKLSILQGAKQLSVR